MNSLKKFRELFVIEPRIICRSFQSYSSFPKNSHMIREIYKRKDNPDTPHQTTRMLLDLIMKYGEKESKTLVYNYFCFHIDISDFLFQ